MTSVRRRVPSDKARGRTFIALAALAWSSAGVIQRNLAVDPATQVVGRAMFAWLGIFVFVTLTERGGTLRAFRSMGRVELAFSLAIAVASGTFILALNDTTVANVLVLQAAAPLLAAALGQVFLGERVTTPTWLATLVAITGVAVMVGGPNGVVSAGLLLAGIAAIAYGASIVLARRRSDVSMAPASCLAQVLLVVCLVPLAHLTHVSVHDLLLLAILGIGQIGLGLVFLTLGARLIPAAEVALISLLEVVLGPVWVWLFRSETPAPATVVGGSLILVAVMLGAMWAPRALPTIT